MAPNDHFELYGSRKDYRITVPCGHCLQCLKKRQQNWFLRANHIFKTLHLRPKDCYFCTFTLDPKVYKDAVDAPYKPIRAYLDRLRKLKRFRRNNIKVKFDYFFVVEFADGDTARKRGLPSSHRMHYHAIFFRCPATAKECEKLWREMFGIAEVDPLRSVAGVRYVMKYMSKDRKACQQYLSDVDQKKNGKIVVSHRFGYLSKEEIKRWRRIMLVSSKSFFCTNVNNYPYSIPRYWKHLCFADEELEALHRALIPPLLFDSLTSKYPELGPKKVLSLTYKLCEKWV